MINEVFNYANIQSASSQYEKLNNTLKELVNYLINQKRDTVKSIDWTVAAYTYFKAVDLQFRDHLRVIILRRPKTNLGDRIAIGDLVDLGPYFCDHDLELNDYGTDHDTDHDTNHDCELNDHNLELNDHSTDHDTDHDLVK